MYIHKRTARFHSLTIPRDALLLDVQVQNGAVTAWYLTADEQGETRTLPILPTGAEVPAHFAKTHVATVQNGAFVWHVFDPEGGTPDA